MTAAREQAPAGPLRAVRPHRHWSLASRLVSGTLVAVLGALVLLGVLVAGFTRFEVTERLDNSLQEVAERLEFMLSALDRAGPAAPDGQVARLPGTDDRRTLAYQIATPDGRLEIRSQNAPQALFVSDMKTGFYTVPSFRVYVTPSASGRHVILVGEPTFHRREAVRHAMLISVLPVVAFFPAIWFMVRWSVRRALRPLTGLQNEIRSRGGANLAPVPPLDLPDELVTIHAAVNLLLERLNLALSTERAFAANAAHELRNPAGALLAQAQLLQRQLGETPYAPRAGVIVAQARRMGRTVEKLLQLSRIGSGMALCGGTVDLVPVIGFLAHELEREKGRRMIVEGADSLLVEGDMDTAGIMLRNLLENALVHGAADQPVRVTVTPDRRVLIANDCPAIDPALLATLEKPFVRGQTEAEGSGLGLAIARQISQLFHAEMSICSPVPGQARGVLVTLAFPPRD